MVSPYKLPYLIKSLCANRRLNQSAYIYSIYSQCRVPRIRHASFCSATRHQSSQTTATVPVCRATTSLMSTTTRWFCNNKNSWTVKILPNRLNSRRSSEVVFWLSERNIGKVLQIECFVILWLPWSVKLGETVVCRLRLTETGSQLAKELSAEPWWHAAFRLTQPVIAVQVSNLDNQSFKFGLFLYHCHRFYLIAYVSDQLRRNS